MTPAQDARAAKMVDVFSDVEIDTALATNPAGVAIAEMADANPRILTLTADLGAVLADFRARHPERYLELGIAVDSLLVWYHWSTSA